MLENFAFGKSKVCSVSHYNHNGIRGTKLSRGDMSRYNGGNRGKGKGKGKKKKSKPSCVSHTQREGQGERWWGGIWMIMMMIMMMMIGKDDCQMVVVRVVVTTNERTDER